MRILLVDDDACVRRSIGRILRVAGYDVDVTSDGTEALAHLQDHPADVLVTDCQMPQMNGLELVRHLRGQGRTLPILMVSGEQGPELKDVAQAAGVTHFLPKGCNPSQLLAVLHQCHSGHAA